MRNNLREPARSWTDRAATASSVRDVLGEVDAITMERLLATGASTEEIAQAVISIEDDLVVGDLQRCPSSSREAEVRAILEELVFESLDEREWERDLARV